jgi:chromate transport protein ChrA
LFSKPVTAVVVDVILNHFPRSGNVDWFAVVVCAFAFVGMLRWKWNIVPVVLGSGLVGLIYALAGFR